MPLQPRLLRTYSRRGGHLRPLPPPDRWISPPQDRKRFFSSTSAGSSTASAGSSAFSAPSDDPDFSPPGKRRREPLGKRPARPWCLRTRRGGGGGEKENRAPGPAVLASPSPSPSPRGPARRRRRQGPPCGARRPLLCSTPQCPPPRRRLRRRRQAPPAELSSLVLLSTTVEGGSGLDGSLELYSPPRRQRTASARSALSSLESSRGDSEQLPPLPGADSVREERGGRSCPKGTGRSGEPGPVLQKSGRVLRASVQGPCRAQAALPPVNGEPHHSAPYDGATSDEPCDDLRRDSTKGSLRCQRGKTKKYQLTPVVVLDPQEVPVWLTSMKLNKKADTEPACQQPVSPLGLQGILEYKHKSTKVVSGEGSTCRKACISGFSASRWGRQTRLCPKRHKNKRQQPPNNSFFRPQMRQKQMKKGVLEMSVDMRDNDYSLLNSSHSWGRVRASLSFHKKKKVTTEESSCSSILCTPSVKYQLSGHQATLSAGKAQCCTWSASSMVLLAPRNSCSVLELMLTDAEKVFGECHQEGPIAFEDCIPLDKMKDCKKIGEGVFGEVFQIDSERGPVALKIIPIEGTERVNGEAQKSFGEILPEIIISKELSLLSEESVNRTVGFISLYSVHCVQGAYPKYLLEAWDKYHKVTGSENDRPDLFGDEQLFMVLEFEFGGSDLEHMRNRFSSVASAKSILHQVTASLAVAEQELHFEHRDLHWGNVLVKKTDVKELNYVLNGATHTIPTAGIHVNIIDYTLSRLEKDGLTVFCDLSTDEELFQGTGDYQFDIYRQMKAENSNSWTDYHPHSNVLWLHYLSDKLLKDTGYKKKESTSAMRKIKQQLIKFHKEVLTFGSANEVLQNSSLFH
ncbi:serine/threonine-protein kinase haspin [Gymnogyps californianus]|uniref:serine/threonine-protein kinase haspin n=1 Tax=Gymnogyps californianus TaxID=33616 RepID=UPI0021C67FAC|nr:serine/threonine-protein kinase haspin [Gymnogyps californianus]